MPDYLALGVLLIAIVALLGFGLWLAEREAPVATRVLREAEVPDAEV